MKNVQISKSEIVANALSKKIKDGAFGPSGQRFISVRKIANEQGVSLVTAQKVLSILKQRGLIEVFANCSYITTGRISEKSPLYQAIFAKEDRLKKNKCIGIHVPVINNLFFAAFLEKCGVAIRNRGYMPVIMCSNKDAESERQILKDFIEIGVKGVISFSNHNDSLKDVYENYILPVVFDEDKLESVVGKNKTVCRRIADHLVEMGYEHFIYVGLNLSGKLDVRRAAYIEELNGRGFAIGKEDAFCLDDDVEYSIPYVLQQKIKHSPKPLGIFCYHDLIAAQILLVCNRLGLQVPQEVGIVGFDNWPIAKQIKPTLTTVSYSFKKMAESAVDRLLGSIENDTDVVPDDKKNFDYILYMNQSTKRK